MAKRFMALLLVVGALAFAAFYILRPSEYAQPAADRSSVAVAAHGAHTQAAQETAAITSDAAIPPPRIDAAASIADALLALQKKHGGDEVRAILARLRDTLHAAAPEAAAQAVLDFLARGADAATGLAFAVGPDGVLAGSPSLRVMLMDLLPALDPDAALEVARQAMDQRSSADEYAISLRNLAWNNFEGDLRAEMVSRFSTMLNEPAWRAKPSAAFLEAFDVAVEIGDRAALSTVASVLDTTREDAATKALNHAAFIALDRMVARAPALLIELYADNPPFMRTNPDLRASLMSRLDITDAQQRATFTTYLQDTTLAPSERSYFAELFPNGNYVYTHHLVTAADTTPSISARRSMDAEVETALDTLQSENPTGPLAATVERIRQRLVSYPQSGAPAVSGVPVQSAAP